jgi:hypothetical protein
MKLKLLFCACVAFMTVVDFAQQQIPDDITELVHRNLDAVKGPLH